MTVKNEKTMSTTLEKLNEAANRAGQTTQALRDANVGTGAVLGDAVLALIGRAADLKRDIARLAEAVRQDESEGAK